MIGKRPFNVRITALTVGAAIVASIVVHAQTRQKGPWWPNPTWGPDDQRGASNWITPEKIVQSLRLVKTGKVYELGHVYEREMRGLSNQRTYNLFLIGPFLVGGENKFVYNDEFVSGALGQIGTQFDGLGHAAMRMKMPDGTEQDIYYNGFTGAEIASAHGLRQLGIEHVKPIITRGVLLDIPGYKGVDTLPDGYEVTVADVRGALQREGIAEASLAPGDAIFFRFGLARYWNDRSPTPGSRPGIGLTVARWVVDRKASMVGSDHSGLEVAAGNLLNPVHQELIMKNGIFNHENLTLDELAADRAYEFLYVFTPLRLKGATGSPGRPIAIR
jgi:kynurenine formamidase